ncbi:exported hypothetical protein [Rubrivivax sp. A210]|nr:exported hypothetical protein [Rubrivivax sp. A210]
MRRGVANTRQAAGLCPQRVLHAPRLPRSTLALAVFLACSGAQAQTSQEVVITGTIADAP